MPDQTTSDKALAVAQLVLGCLLPAYLASQPKPPVDLYRYFPVPPPLLIGLATPIPLALTGEGRDIDREDVIRQGIEALEAFETLLDGSDWAMGAP